MRYRKDGKLDLRFRGAKARQAMLDAAKLTAAQGEAVQRLLERWRTPPVAPRATASANPPIPDLCRHHGSGTEEESPRTEPDRIALLRTCVTASLAWSVIAAAVFALMAAAFAIGARGDGFRTAPEPRDRPGLLFFAGGCACWWAIRAKQALDVRRAISRGELDSSLEGSQARSAKLWLLLEGASTFVPGTCCIGPPILVLTVIGNRPKGAQGVPRIDGTSQGVANG